MKRQTGSLTDARAKTSEVALRGAQTKVLNYLRCLEIPLKSMLGSKGPLFGIPDLMHLYRFDFLHHNQTSGRSS